jgi:hypothetical protein
MKYSDKRFNFLFVYLVLSYLSLIVVMLLGYFFPGNIAPNELPWAVYLCFGLCFIYVIIMIVFMLVCLRADKKEETKTINKE